MTTLPRIDGPGYYQRRARQALDLAEAQGATQRGKQHWELAMLFFDRCFAMSDGQLCQSCHLGADCPHARSVACHPV